MSLSRKQMLDEMGLSPQWTLRDQPAVVCGEASARGITSAASPAPRPTPSVETQDSFVESAPERAQHIAGLGWDQLRQSIAECRACGLCAQRKQTVPGVGDERADWLFIGEGPGAEEDARGEPFVGVAGKLLDAMLAAIELKRGENVYIANAVKCRPPGNRTPEAAEMAACAPYLKRQIALIAPRLIVLLGRAAVHALLGEVGSLASLRGKPLAYRDGKNEIPVIVTYHPAYLLRTLSDKAKAWEDLCRARALMRQISRVQAASPG
ncbi:MAG: uracil-DNA glycosylase [Propionivibrio sp.]|uniref:Type-4 uracil-DNA glycosylase n=1 Tax=Candidatus Propionivibrio dominans TaxID=2954373 RepID=A0A9D7FGK9_9RHOO|nr:uracil-DNA glycosylase [Candidatus Propionivibrio dominans]